MRKFILILMIVGFMMAFNSCSSDSNKSSTPTAIKGVTVTIDGVAKTFLKIDATQQPWTANGTSGVDLFFTATNTANPNEILQLNIGQGDLGDNQIWGLYYTKDGTNYAQDDTGVTSRVDINSDKRVKGSFSGTIKSTDGQTVYILNNGLFDISY